MARQPIYDGQLHLHAYELLFREAHSDCAGQVDDEQAALSLVSTLVDIGLRELIGDARAFVNVTEKLLFSSSILMLPKEKVVVELLETIRPSHEVFDRVSRLKNDGYVIALDDYRPALATKPLLRFADFVKFDVLDRSENDIQRDLDQMGVTRIKLLAEKVETQEQYRICQRLGFDYFQGYFFAKPELMRGSSLHTNQIALLRLAAKIQAPSIQYAELEEIISSDVSLSYRLLKLVKSAHFGLSCTVTSIRQALMFLGVNTVSALATLLAMAGTSNKPHELLTTALIRAKMCETLASNRRMRQPDRYFTVGLLSVLDALLDAPMCQVLDELPLAGEINQALLDPQAAGDLGTTLIAALRYERGEWDNCRVEGLTPADVANAYHNAVNWTGLAEMAIAA